MLKPDISVSVNPDAEPPQWYDENRIRNFVDDVLTRLEYTNWEVSLLFCDDAFIRKLNADYRQIDSPTDVLSFEQGDSYTDDEGQTVFVAGDIVISFDSLSSNAIQFDVSENEELKRLIIHGILHLAGFDHSDNSPEQPMLISQETILKNYADYELIPLSTRSVKDV